MILTATLVISAALQGVENQNSSPRSLKYGREAMEAGSYDQAYKHLMWALERQPDNLEVVDLLLENAALASDDDARALWSHDWVNLAADKRGKVKPKAQLESWWLEEDPHPRAIAKARASAVRDLSKFRAQQDKDPRAGTGLVSEWAEDLGRTLAAGSPALAASYAEDFDPEFVHDRDIWRKTIAGLERVIRTAQSSGDHATVIRAARCLAGLSRQSAFEDDCHGPAPISMSRSADIAAGALNRSRHFLAQKPEFITPLDELELMGLDEQRGFTLDHASFANPGATYSPKKLYRVETSCGWETLYGTATTVEEHHQRLLNWFGEDPFNGRQGIMRIVPESHGLEAEGAPFFWAGGFQGGDTTVLRFTIGTIPGLGRGITHELTHRFDGATFGGLPGWLAEGRAVWTGSAYGSIYDTEFVEMHANPETMTSTRNLGYGKVDKLTELITGDMEEYRDNYTAGYALFVFLNTWSGVDDDAQTLFADNLQKYMRKRNRKGEKTFVKHFADGKNGRPDGLEEFAKEFDDWLKGWHWREPAKWTKRYTQNTPPGDPAPIVFDEPTWTWLRGRAEPWFGQDQARQAAELFVENAMWKEAVTAFEWVLRVDEPSDYIIEQLSIALGHTRSPHAEWVASNWRRLDSPRRRNQPQTPPPFLPRLRGANDLLNAYAAAASDYLSRNVKLAAAAMISEHDRLAFNLGLPTYSISSPTLIAANQFHPFFPISYPLGRNGWREDDLIGHEERRVEGLWFEDLRNGDVHVGRDKARTDTGTMDRGAPWRDAFVLADEWQDAGRWRLRTQIELTTSYLKGGVIVGWTRRDRFIKLSLSAGDFAYANGQDDARSSADMVHWSLDGRWTRGGASSGSVSFSGEKTTFDVELLIDGPTIEVLIDGQEAGVFTTLDAHPIQGHVGFFTSQGAMRARLPVVQRLDRDQEFAWGGGLHPNKGGATEWRDLNGRPVTGLPLHPSGSLLLWFPEQLKGKGANASEEEKLEHYLTSLRRFLEDYAADKPSQGITVVLPNSIGVKTIETMRHELKDLVAPGLAFTTHSRPEPEESQWTVGGWAQPWLAFVDPAGILRKTERLKSWRTGLPQGLEEMLRQYQDHTRPGVAGASD